jgi:tetratricopeptide (TPR) repeat protein
MPTPTEPELRYWSDLRSQDPQRSRSAAHVLSSLLCQRGERSGAERLLRDSLKAHGPDGAAETWFRLGRLLEEESRAADAEAAFAQAFRLASVEDAPEVLMEIAALRVAVGDVSRAVELYTLVAERASRPGLRALASYRLGTIQIELGLPESASGAFRRALAEADSALEPFVLAALAEILISWDEATEAAELLQRAIAGDHHDQAPRAALALARLRSREGDGLEAYRLYQLVVESEHPELSSLAEAEKEHLVESELNSLLTPTRERPPQSPAMGGTPFAKRLFLTRSYLRVEHFRPLSKHEGMLAVPLAGGLGINGKWTTPISEVARPCNLLVCDPDTHRLLDGDRRPPPLRGIVQARLWNNYLTAWIASLLRAELPVDGGDTDDDIRTLLRSYIDTLYSDACEMWRSPAGVAAPSAHGGPECEETKSLSLRDFWSVAQRAFQSPLEPLVTETTRRRITEEALTERKPAKVGDSQPEDPFCELLGERDLTSPTG